MKKIWDVLAFEGAKLVLKDGREVEILVNKISMNETVEENQFIHQGSVRKVPGLHREIWEMEIEPVSVRIADPPEFLGIDKKKGLISLSNGKAVVNIRVEGLIEFFAGDAGRELPAKVVQAPSASFDKKFEF